MNKRCAIVLVDVNNFYAKLFRPDLKERPIVVLSNNDGCVVARSAEVKALGIKMGVPYFQIRQFIEAIGGVWFSSNYTHYGDIFESDADVNNFILLFSLTAYLNNLLHHFFFYIIFLVH